MTCAAVLLLFPQILSSGNVSQPPLTLTQPGSELLSASSQQGRRAPTYDAAGVDA